MDPIPSLPASPHATINQRPITIHNLIDLGSTRINPDLIPFMMAVFGCSPIAVPFNSQAPFKKIISPLWVRTNLEDLLLMLTWSESG
jgi:hypothetical protein